MLKVGTRVKPSWHALEASRDRWLNAGRYSDKERAKRHLEKEAARRGTITAVLTADWDKGTSDGYTVTWDDGGISHTMTNRVEEAKE